MSTIWQSDLRVKMRQKRSSTRNSYEVRIATDNDDASRSPHLIFALPRNSRVIGIKFSDGFEQTAYQIYGNHSQAQARKVPQIDGYVKVDFQNLNKEKLSVFITIKPVGDGWQRGDGASAYVFSLTPELKKKNNFAYLPL